MNEKDPNEQSENPSEETPQQNPEGQNQPEPPEPPLPPTQKDVVLYHGENISDKQQQQQATGQQAQGQQDRQSNVTGGPPPARQTIAILMIVAAAVSILGSLVLGSLVLGSLVLGVTTLICIPAFLIYLPLGGYYIYTAVKMLKDDTHVLPTWIPIVMICHIITCDLIGCGLGITCLVLSKNPEFIAYQESLQRRQAA